MCQEGCPMMRHLLGFPHQCGTILGVGGRLPLLRTAVFRSVVRWVVGRCWVVGCCWVVVCGVNCWVVNCDKANTL